ncbi:hypothetical protein FQZ97_979580 [compost metagenome]
MSAALADDHRQLGLEVELLGDFRPQQRGIVGQQGLGEALEDHRVLAHRAAGLCGVGDIVDAHADDLAGGGYHRIQLDLGERIVGRRAGDIGPGLFQQAGVGQQCGQVGRGRELLAQVDDLLRDYCAEARLAVIAV